MSNGSSKKAMEDRLKKIREKNITPENYLMSDDDEQEEVEQPELKETEQEEYNEPENNKTVQAQEDEEVDQKRSKLVNFSKKKVEETHTRRTFLVENTLFKRLNNLSKGKHGFKTEFINYAIEKALIELEDEFGR